MSLQNLMESVPNAADKPVRSEDTLKAELTAMRHIATALAELDETTRARVLRWAGERFASAPTTAADARESTPLDSVDALAVASLGDLFGGSESRHAQDSSLSLNELPEGPGESVAGLVHEFVTEFQAILRQWNGAGEDETAAPEVVDQPPAKPRLSLVTRRAKNQRASRAV